MNSLNVLNVYWDSIPERDHNHILDVIPQGGYVASLPNVIAEKFPVIKVAVLGNLKAAAKYDISDLSVCETKIRLFGKQ